MNANKLLISLVVCTETVFFACLILAFVYFSLVPGFHELQLSALDWRVTGGFTLLLFASSFTYMAAERSYRRAQTGGVKGWLLLTIGLGTVFLLGQAHEFWGLYQRQLGVASGTFGTSFFTLTGFHGLHVLAGLVVLSILAVLAFLGDFDRPGSTLLGTVGIYWHFVDIVWAVVFTLVYILPHFSKL